MGEHAGYHEPLESLDAAVMDRHRAIVSLQEELEAVDWYEERIVTLPPEPERGRRRAAATL